MFSVGFIGFCRIIALRKGQEIIYFSKSFLVVSGGGLVVRENAVFTFHLH